MAKRYVPPALRGQSRDIADAPRSSSSNSSIPTFPVSTGLRTGNTTYMAGGSTSSGLRGGRGSSTPLPTGLVSGPEERLYSDKEIDRYFWPGEDLKAALVEKSKTLHDSASTPGVLTYVLLFNDANPRWESDGIIFTKSSLHLLPTDPADNGDGSCASPSTSATTNATSSSF